MDSQNFELSRQEKSTFISKTESGNISQLTRNKDFITHYSLFTTNVWQLLWKRLLCLFLWTSAVVEATEDEARGAYSSESWRVVLILTGTVFAIIGEDWKLRKIKAKNF